MLKNMCQLEWKIADKAYQFICENDAPLAHAKDALLKFLQYVGQIEDQAKAQQEAQKNQESQDGNNNLAEPSVANVEQLGETANAS